MLTVVPSLQASGIGRKILQTAEEWVSGKWNLQTIELGVIRQRETLISWYLRRGYTSTGRSEPFPYDDPRCGIPKVTDLDFVILEKRLSLR